MFLQATDSQKCWGEGAKITLSKRVIVSASCKHCLGRRMSFLQFYTVHKTITVVIILCTEIRAK